MKGQGCRGEYYSKVTVSSRLQYSYVTQYLLERTLNMTLVETETGTLVPCAVIGELTAVHVSLYVTPNQFLSKVMLILPLTSVGRVTLTGFFVKNCSAV